MAISSPGEAVANSQDILTQILLRLPTKSLVRFKCVSTHWLSLISCPQFIAAQVRRQGTLAPSGLLLNNDYLPTPEFQYVSFTHSNHSKFDANPPPYLSYLGVPRIKILQSCNGLLLCSSAYLTDDPDFKNTAFDFGIPHDFITSVSKDDCGIRIFVCNPITMQFKTINLPSDEVGCAEIEGVNMAFDPTHSPHFKIVCVLRSSNGADEVYSLRVYESQNNAWKPSLINFDPPEATHFGAPVFFRRAIHWYSEEQTSLCFDVDEECLNPIPMPRYLTRNTIQYFGESRGQLQLIMHTTSDVEFDVLELEEDYSGWRLRHRVNLATFRVEFCDMYGVGSEWFRVSVLRMVEAGAERQEESELVLFVCGRLFSYRLKDGSLKQLMCLVPYEKAECEWENAFPFIETLCPV
ncbi:hypothetical protein ACFX11_022850 [Malus domestica]